ncbi:MULTISPECIES: dolichyl-phosphate-mannose--protein mannosyltransferase [Citricoccus]|uniref:dolichyl-phosphate-mannose--protein mannosyltransferase n=1 Tax=Citricoccus TaxID=169133 RepID=UPI000255F13D|nr:phospholipid carrier-dependent glycosyltransferase [Citricoccus sp. CH26A]
MFPPPHSAPSAAPDAAASSRPEGREPAPVRARWLETPLEAYTEAALRLRLLGERFHPGPWGWIVPLAVTLVAAVLRLARLDHPDQLVFDETYYVKDAFTLLQAGYELNWPEEHNEQFAAGDPRPEDSPEYVVHPPLGKWLIALGMLWFGTDHGVGWRFSAAIAGTLSVLLTALIAQRLFRSVFLGGVAGLLLAVEGHHLVLSRTGLLDIFLSFFVLAAFGALLLDRAHGRALLARRLAGVADRHGGVPPPWAVRHGPWLGWRPWRLVAGVLLGAACGVKLSGLAFVAVFGLMSVLWDANARRVAGIRHWLRAGIVRDGLYAFVAVVGVGALTYLATWTGWLVTAGGYNRQWHLSHPPVAWWEHLVPGALRSLADYHRQSTQFHGGLESGHDYASSPWTWPFMGRPTSFYYQGYDDGAAGCPVETCSAAITDLANPVIWWAGLLAVLALVLIWLGRRDWRAGAILGAYAAGQLVWFLWPDRTMFFFYTVAYAPFLVLAVTLCLGALLRLGGPVNRRRNTVLVLSFVLVAVLTSAFFMPVWTGEMIPYEQWRARMWMSSWI